MQFPFCFMEAGMRACAFFFSLSFDWLVNVNNTWQSLRSSVRMGLDLQEPKWFPDKDPSALQVCRTRGSFLFKLHNLTGVVV